MNKKLLLVLLISALLLFCFAWVYARHVDETKGTTTTERSSQEVLQKLRDLARKIKPDIEPEVKLEDMPALPHTGEVKKPTVEQSLEMLNVPLKDQETLLREREELQQRVVGGPCEEALEGLMDYCVVWVNDLDQCCYRWTVPGWEFYAYVPSMVSTWQDPQYYPDVSACGYPIFPFMVDTARIYINAPAACSILCNFAIRDFEWDHCSPYPGAVIAETEPVWIQHDGGSQWLYAAFDPPVCLYDRYFVDWYFWNGEEFDPTCLDCFEPPLEGYDTCIVSIDTLYDVCIPPPLPEEDTCIVSVDTTYWCDTLATPPFEDSCVARVDAIVMGYWECVEGEGPDPCVFSTKDVFGHWVCEDSCAEPVIEGLEICLVRTDTLWGHLECIPDPEGEDVCVAETLWGDWKIQSIDTVFGHWEEEYIDTTWGHPCDINLDAKYSFVPQVLFDLADKCEMSYWSFRYYWTIGVFYDAVCRLPMFTGMGGSAGTYVMNTYGYVTDQNDCPDEEFFWQKEAFEEYAPCGLPDFDQKEKEAMHPEIGPFDGPTATANCLWWMVSAGMLEPFWKYQDPPRPDCWMHPDNVPFLINELADYMKLGDCGVTPEQLDAGLEELAYDKLLFFTHEEIQAPTWEEIEYNCRISQDVLLLLGFWYIEDISGEPPETTWTRIGGHWVTVAGVDQVHGLLKISDPDLDAAEMGMAPGIVCSNPRFIPHDHGADPFCHNDAGNVSHDIYPVMPSITPCGEVMLVGYPYLELDLNKYLGHNLNPGCEAVYIQPEVIPQVEIFVEIEAAKVICPEEPYQGGDLYSWDFNMYKTNYGEEGAENTYAWVWWMSPYGPSNNLWIGSIVLGTDANDLAVGLLEIGPSNFQPASYYNLYDPIEWTHVAYFDSTVGGDSANAEFVSKKNTDLWVRMYAWGFVDLEYKYPQINQAVYQEFTTTNKGDSTISDIMFAMFLDMDPFYDPDAVLHPRGTGDSTLNTIGMFEATKPAHIDYLTLAPTYEGKFVPSACVEEQNTYLYPDVPGPYPALDSVMNLPYWKLNEGLDPPVFDWAELLVSEKFTLAPDEQNVETYIMWADSTLLDTLLDGTSATNPAKNTLYCHLTVMGFYRGDVDSDGDHDLADAKRIANTYFGKTGWHNYPFLDQGDVDGDGAAALSDAKRVANTYFGVSGFSYDQWIDYARFQFGAGYWERTSLFADDDWKDIGK